MRSPLLTPKAILLAAGDAAIGLVALFSALLARHGGVPDSSLLNLWRFAAPFLLSLWLAGFVIFGLYDLRAAKNEPRFFEKLGRAIAFNFAVSALLFYLVPGFGIRPLATLFLIFVILSVLMFVWRAASNALAVRLSKERVLFLGLNEEVMELVRFLTENPQLGFVPAAAIPDGNGSRMVGIPDTPGLNVLAPGSDLDGAVRAHAIDRIVASHGLTRTKALARSLFSVVPLGVAITDFPRFYESVRGRIPVSLLNEAWFIENLAGAKRPKYEFGKRILDLVLAVVFGAAALVLLPAIALAIAASTHSALFGYRRRRARPGDGIIFFRQERVGKNGRRFNFLKFRSQVLGAERMGGEKNGDGGYDPRAYPLGIFLRKTYLDELPQIWNVIRGEMSFVGPRPERPEFVSELEREIPFYRMRELVLPGITGWAQINMETDASVSDAPLKLQYDLYYIKNRSLALDLAILLKTALKLLQRSGR